MDNSLGTIKEAYPSCFNSRPAQLWGFVIKFAFWLHHAAASPSDSFHDCTALKDYMVNARDLLQRSDESGILMEIFG